jgi:hypothetical protein
MSSEAEARVLLSIPEEKRKNWRDLVRWFAEAEDRDLADIIHRLPVSDVEVVSVDSVQAEYCIRFAKVMKIAYLYEKEIRLILTGNFGILADKKEIDEKALLRMKKSLYQIVGLKELLTGDIKKQEQSLDPQIDIERVIGMDRNVEKQFPNGYRFLQGEISLKVEFQGELQAEVMRSRQRFSTLRRREFRRCLSQSYQIFFNRYLDKGAKMNNLHQTRLDSIVIDVYNSDLMTFRSEIKDAVRSSSAGREASFEKDGLIKLSFIEALEVIEKDAVDNQGIDELIQRLRTDLAAQEEHGELKRGKIVQKHPFGTVEFTFDPYNSGAPIRLRIIANVQSLIQCDLFKERPELVEKYRNASWTGDSEINFILPEDYEYYYRNEPLKTRWLMERAEQLYYEMLAEFVGISVLEKEKTIVYVSQFEVCDEVPFSNTKFMKPFNRAVSPEMCDSMTRKLIWSQRLCDKAQVSYDSKTRRYCCYFDIMSPDPTLPIMQFKIYPKFHYDGVPWFRYEMIPTRFAKYIEVSDIDNPKGLNFQLLSSPARTRELVERLYQFEAFCNGNGHGYNKRLKAMANPKPDIEMMVNITASAVWPGSCEKHIDVIKQMLRIGQLPKGVSCRARQKLEKFGIISKQRRGVYLTTPVFMASVGQAREAEQISDASKP